jgi:hypothetical protein
MPSVVVSGSMRKNYKGMVKTIREFENNGVSVLSPRVSEVINPGETFALLKSDRTKIPKRLEQSHLDAIDSANALYVYNPRGRIGQSAGYEIAWARKAGIPIFVKKALATDSIYRFHAGAKEASVEKVAKTRRDINN